MNTTIDVDPHTDRLLFLYNGQVQHSISKKDALALMEGIAEVYGIRIGDPKCPCKDKVPQTFDRYANRWRIAV